MRLVRPRLGVTGWVAIAVLVLLPALAVLQYRWLGRLSEAERERVHRTLITATQQFSHELETELGRTVTSLQVDATTLEREAWDVFAQRYEAWAASAIAPGVVNDIYLALLPTAGDSAAVTLRAWDARNLTFADAPWTSRFAAIRSMLDAQVQHTAGRAATRMEGHLGNERLPVEMLVSPIVRVSPGDPGLDHRAAEPEVRLLGFTILTLDLDVVGSELLPGLVRRHLYDADGSTQYRIALVDRTDERVLFESEPGAAAAVLVRHDVSMDTLGARPAPFPGAPASSSPRARMLVNVVGSETGSLPTVQARLVGGQEGPWRLLVAHQAGSLEAAVAAVRYRNLALSSGILLLLTVAFGLIAGSARRAHALARRQAEFVAVVTHELRTPVAVIHSTAGNLADGVVEQPADVRTYGAMIQGEARRLGETVERVLQLAGLEGGNSQPIREAISAEALVRESIEACAGEIARLGAHVESDVPSDLPAMTGDPAALRSALRNLVENAIKYSDEPRWVRVNARGGPRDAHRTEVRICVEDRGFGIASTDRPHIFEPFYRGRDALGRQIQGSGLGLSLVSRIVQAHNGRVTVETEPGRGTRVTLHLPGAAAAQSAEPFLPAGRVPARVE